MRITASFQLRQIALYRLARMVHGGGRGECHTLVLGVLIGHPTVMFTIMHAVYR